MTSDRPPGDAGEAGASSLPELPLSKLIDSAVAEGGATLGGFTGSISDARLEEVIGGRYRLLELIGEGGFGTVFRAQQLHPVRREVALKLIKLGMDTQAVIGRFEAERQALALMDHPNVAKVHDAGSTRQGRPFFVMELVAGEPITAYCDRNNLSTRQRLELFIQVCNAVGHAHTKGIIHRDIKPGNVLVTVHDDKPVPKVIDFGIAKATSAALTEQTLFTEHRQFIGTPEYMSPEQAHMGGLDVDTRTDIYSLGVLLYELLTGAAPFDARRLRKAGYEEIQRIIREEDPPRPSTRVAQRSATQRADLESRDGQGIEDAGLQSSSQEVARHRGTRPSLLSRQLRGDLDWIVMKSLEKDRTRRYESASAFAEDVQRHLSDQPVEASPPSLTYRFAKFARRHTGALATAAALAIVLVLGMTTTVVGFVKARQEARRAHEAEQDALAQRDSAERAEADAIVARDESEEVTAFLIDMLTAADPGSMGRDVTVRQVLDEASAQLGGRFTKRPLVEARLEDAIGRTYQGLGFLPQAQPHLSAALDRRLAVNGPRSAETLLATSRLAVLYHLMGQTARASQMLGEALAAAESELGPEHDVTLTLLQNRGALLRAEGQLTQAEAVLRDALKRAQHRYDPDHSKVLAIKHNLALLLETLGRYAEAKEFSLEVVNARRRREGSRHPQTLVALHNLAALEELLGRAPQAINLLEGTIRTARDSLGPDHPRTLGMERSLCHMYLRQNKLTPARELADHVYETERKLFGADSSRAIQAALTLAAVKRQQGELEESERMLRQILPIAREALGADHETTVQCLAHLAAVLQKRGDAVQGVALLEQALAINARTWGDAHPNTLPMLRNLAAMYRAEKRYEESAIVYMRHVEAQRALYGPTDARTMDAMVSAAATLVQAERFEDAESLAQEVYAQYLATLGEADTKTLAAARLLVRLYDTWEKPAEAATWRARLPARSGTPPAEEVENEVE